MTTEIPIIETKFVPPVVKDSYIRRPSLMIKQEEDPVDMKRILIGVG
ncbi:hypothetical protein NQ095_14660 [Rossellomorea sp. SC111]|nr:hypothetical protein [Rossellomorea sp. SC111]MCR8849657.1 hypothetical protein [Rossellomorea sp. SC111]